MVSTFFYTLLTLFCEITFNPQYDLVYKIHTQLRLKMHSSTSSYNISLVTKVDEVKFDVFSSNQMPYIYELS